VKTREEERRESKRRDDRRIEMKRIEEKRRCTQEAPRKLPGGTQKSPT